MGSCHSGSIIRPLMDSIRIETAANESSSPIVPRIEESHVTRVPLPQWCNHASVLTDEVCELIRRSVAMAINGEPFQRKPMDRQNNNNNTTTEHITSILNSLGQETGEKTDLDQRQRMRRTRTSMIIPNTFEDEAKANNNNKEFEDVDAVSNVTENKQKCSAPPPQPQQQQPQLQQTKRVAFFEAMIARWKSIDMAFTSTFIGNDMIATIKIVSRILGFMAENCNKLDDVATHPKIRHISRVHAKVGVLVQSYDHVAQSILFAFRVVLGSEFTEDMHNAWIKLFSRVFILLFAVMSPVKTVYVVVPEVT